MIFEHNTKKIGNHKQYLHLKVVLERVFTPKSVNFERLKKKLGIGAEHKNSATKAVKKPNKALTCESGA